MSQQICDIHLINHYLIYRSGGGNDTDNGTDDVYCSLYFPKLVSDILFIYVAFLILIYQRCRIRRKASKRVTVNGTSQNNKKEKLRSSRNINEVNVKKVEKLFNMRTVFIHHVSVWCLTLFLFICVCGDLAENILVYLYKNTDTSVINVFIGDSTTNASDAGVKEFLMNSSSDTQGDGVFPKALTSESVKFNENHKIFRIIYSYLKIVGPFTNLIALCVLLFFYHHIERWRKSKYLCIIFAFFFISGVFHGLNVYIFVQLVNLSWPYMKFLVNVFAVVTSIGLMGLISHVVIHEGSCKKLPVSQSQGNFMSSNIRYLHNYSTLPSRTTFYWFTGLLRLGYWHPLEEEDLGDLPDEEKTLTQLKRFQNVFDLERASNSKESFSLWKCLFKTVWSSMLVGGLFRILADFIGFIPPLGIKAIVAYTELNYTLFDDDKQNQSLNDSVNGFTRFEAGSGEHLTISQLVSNGYVMALIVLLASFLQSTFSQCSTFLVNSEGIHVKFALQALIYKKSLTLSPTKHSQNDVPIATDTATEGTLKSEPADYDSDADKESGISSTCQSNDTTSTHSVFDNGLIVNVMSEDANNIMMFFWMAHFIWAIPLKLVVLMTLLYLQLGYSALIGAGVCVFIMIPLQFLIGKKMSCNSKELMERCDERLRTMSEILQGMKLLKLHGWELIFSDKVYQIRQKELKNLDKDLLFRSIMTFMTHISSVLMTVVTFGLYQFIETEKLEPPKVFAGLALFNQLTVPLFIFPIIVPIVIDALVSIRRIKDFLLLPEVTSYLPDHEDSEDSNNDSHKPANDDNNATKSQNLMNISSNKRHNSDLQASTDSVFVLENIAEDDEDVIESRKNSYEFNTSSKPLLENVTTTTQVLSKRKSISHSCTVSLKDAYFSWDASGSLLQQQYSQSSRNNGLSKISVDIPKEKLTVIVGPTGGGKSSFISALLGEMHKTSGEIIWGEGVTIAYAAQKPWILNASVRENILFGKSYKPGRYKKVIQACALQPDIEILAQRDLTEIGQRGINLSGGQKQRIAIARALYSHANVVVLDDPLSALDTEVAHHVLDAGIMKFLLKSRRTVILVTHHLPVLHHAHHILAMENGRIRIQGTLLEIKKTDPECYKVWQEMINRKEHELKVIRETKTAKERWTLLKLVSKVGIQFKYNKTTEKPGWNEEEARAQLEPFRARKGTFSHYKHLSHDMFLPSDECHDDMMTPLLRRRACNRTSRDSRTFSTSGNHIQLQRMSSLQPDIIARTRSPLMGKKFKRLQSLPVDEDIPSGSGNQVTPGKTPSNISIKPYPSPTEMTSVTNCECPRSPCPRSQYNFLKKIFVSKKTRTSSTNSSNVDFEKVSASSRLSSTVSGASGGELTEDDCEDPEEALLEKYSSQEEREYGKIPWRVYLSYINACGKVISGLYLYTAIGYEVVRVCTNLWLSEWSDTVHQHKDDQKRYDDEMSYYFNIYVLLSLATVIVSLSCNLLGKQAGARSREILHQRMLDRIVRCPVRFFEGTPMGRIINRFSSDVAVVDRKLCISMQRFLQFVFLCCSAIVVNAIVNAWFIFAAIPIVAIYYYIQRFYRSSSRELQRIQAISRGPIYSHFHETLEGLSTIRAYRVQKRFTDEMLTTLDYHNIADMFINVGNRWLSISLDYLGGVIVFLATIAAVISSQFYPETVTASMVGLAINYTFLVPVYLNWVIKFLAEVEMFMNSVDRIDRYTELEIEDYEGSVPEDSLPPNWPSRGEVRFEDVSIHYGADRPPIISGLTVNVAPTQKVGICGRSGSGKSSLLMALFRISDVKSGRILIDDVDIHKIPLLKLRSSFSVIPQENILFSGTLRFNLDPEGKVPDIDIWNALQRCQMESIVKEMPGQLDAEVNSSGVSFSAGEKQLLALARAILHKSKVVIMDEATSSVDLWTERTLLQAVKETFKESTVLTIAHRIDTIIDGNRVLILEDGKLAEDGNPGTLMKQPMSHFATIIRNADQSGNT